MAKHSLRRTEVEELERLKQLGRLISGNEGERAQLPPPNTDKDRGESYIVADRIEATSGQCYYNAYMAIQLLPEYGDWDYVEGLAVVSGIPFPIEHGWIEKDGVVIDPTLIDDEVAYFAGLRFSGIEGLAEIAIDYLPIFQSHGFCGAESPHMNAARNAAFTYAGIG